ncbi:Fe-S cluster assembly ATPase SufC [Candidatus Curtissbacteria bacterium]|nr:Fe-S cluster assembly ATPase SufC [Candidatus Curtissbacteria bacterium]
MLKVKNLKASIDNKEILKGVDLMVKPGEVHVLMGPNGSGKSTLAQVIAGHPAYKVVSGKCSVDSREITKLTPDKRAKLGIFLGFQHPVEVPGVSVFSFMRKANKNPQSKIQNSKSINIFRDELKKYMSELKLPEDFLRRALNEGFSGGEKKRNEILQMMTLKPKLVILDEIDSGLDVDGLQLVATAIKTFKKNNPRSSFVLITHYARILKYLKADHVHVMVEGRIVESGTGRLATKVEEKGYQVWQTV